MSMRCAMSIARSTGISPAMRAMNTGANAFCAMTDVILAGSSFDAPASLRNVARSPLNRCSCAASRRRLMSAAGTSTRKCSCSGLRSSTRPSLMISARTSSAVTSAPPRP